MPQCQAIWERHSSLGATFERSRGVQTRGIRLCCIPRPGHIHIRWPLRGRNPSRGPFDVFFRRQTERNCRRLQGRLPRDERPLRSVFDSAKGTISFHIDRASFPDWDDTIQVRAYEMTGDELTCRFPLALMALSRSPSCDESNRIPQNDSPRSTCDGSKRSSQQLRQIHLLVDVSFQEL